MVRPTGRGGATAPAFEAPGVDVELLPVRSQHWRARRFRRADSDDVTGRQACPVGDRLADRLVAWRAQGRSGVRGRFTCPPSIYTGLPTLSRLSILALLGRTRSGSPEDGHPEQGQHDDESHWDDDDREHRASEK